MHSASKRDPESKPGATLVRADVKTDVNASTKGAKISGASISLACLLARGLAGCFSPDLSGAECLSCPDNVCPGDLVCTNRHCLRPGSSTTCSSEPPGTGGTSNEQGAAGSTGNAAQGGSTGPAAGGDGAQASGGRGAHGSGGTGARASGGNGGNGGTDSSEGGTSAAAGEPGMLPIQFEPVSLCTHAMSGSLTSAGGTPPYTFTIAQTSNFEIVTEGDHSSLQGTPATSGDYSVLVRVSDAADGHGESTITFHVNETPVVRTTTLPSACPDQKYTADLEADGGNSAHYVFKADVEPPSGLGVDGSQLGGHFKNDSGLRASVSVQLSVESDGCWSAPVMLQLTAESASAAVCPHIGIVGGEPSLPAPCAGNPYYQSFSAWGGTQGYSWAADNVPAGLEFDAGTRTLSGIPEGGGTLTIEVTDAKDRTVQSYFELEPARQKCWLAYLAPSSGATRLNLFDSLLDNRASFPSDTASPPVLDFKFSPDGRFIAYRTGTLSSAAQLSLLEVAGFRRQSFDFDGVTQYAWSDDARTLAVGFGGSDDPRLGGVDLSGDGGSGTTPLYPELTPLEVTTPLAAAPVWSGGTNVGFLSLIDGYAEIKWATRGASGFAGLNFPDDGSYGDGVFVRAAPEGLFVIPRQDDIIAYYGTDGAAAVLHDQVLVAPNGRFAAGQANGSLEVFKPVTASFSTSPDVVADGTQTGCDAVLAWASDASELACARTKSDDAAQADIVIFDIAPGTGVPAPARTVQDVYVHPSPAVGMTGLARLFSPSGQRLAFATDTMLYSAPTASGAATVDLSESSASPAGSDVKLGFSLDERFLVEHRGTKLRLFDLKKPPIVWPDVTGSGEDPAPAAACSEDLRAPALAPPAHAAYCGDFTQQGAFSWCPDSRLVAVATSDGRLLVKDLRFDGVITTKSATDACGAGCVAGDRFAFQPDPDAMKP